MATKKTNKKIIIIALITVLVAAAIIAGIAICKNANSKLYSGDGMYYHQTNSDTFQFKEDNTFTYTKPLDDGTSDVLTGKWSKEDNEVTLTFESDTKYAFGTTEDGYIYRKDRVYRGVTSEEKLLNNIYVLEQDGKKVEELFFANDGTMEVTQGKTIISRGTYTRVDNILIVRRTTLPDSYGKRIDITERYLVLDNGITKEIYAKTPAENIAK